MGRHHLPIKTAAIRWKSGKFSRRLRLGAFVGGTAIIPFKRDRSAVLKAASPQMT